MERTIPFYLGTIYPESIAQGKSVLIASSENAIRGLLMHLCEVGQIDWTWLPSILYIYILVFFHIPHNCFSYEWNSFLMAFFLCSSAFLFFSLNSSSFLYSFFSSFLFFLLLFSPLSCHSASATCFTLLLISILNLSNFKNIVTFAK